MSDYLNALARYELIRERTLPHMGDPNTSDYDPVLSPITMAVRSCASELIEELKISWRALHDKDRDLGDRYTSDLSGRIYMIFRGLRALAEYIEQLPTREDVYANAARQAAIVEVSARQLLAEKFGLGHTNGGLTVHMIADDGHPWFRSASVDEVVDALVDAGLLADRVTPQ